MIHIILALEVLLTLLIVLSVYTTIFSTGYFIREKFLAYYHKWKKKRRLRQWEKDYELILQERRKKELCRKEKEKYPLFYLKDGIV